MSNRDIYPKNSLPVQTADEARQLDSASIEKVPIAGSTLMEVAGAKSADIIRNHCSGDSLLFLCGSGNNTGDALVIARHLADEYSCELLMLRDKEDLSDDAKLNLERLLKLHPDLPVHTNPSVIATSSFSWIIDGLLGTGLASDVRAPYDEVIDLANSSEASVVALDIPSGLNATTGEIMGTAIRADITCTFGYPKTGCYFGSGSDLCGNLFPVDLGFPKQFNPTKRFTLSESEEIPSLDNSGIHKYKNGVVYIIGGSPGLTGAVVHAAKSAWKSGVGSVFVIAPAGLFSVYDTLLPEAVKCYVGKPSDVIFNSDHVDEALSYITHQGVCLAGPGMGTAETTGDFLNSILNNLSSDFPVVLDADAIRLVDLSQIEGTTKSVILTPHPGELSALTKNRWNNEFERMEAAEKLAQKHHITIISKGTPTIIAQNRSSYIVTYSQQGFNRIGFGDVLSGTIAAYRTIFSETDASKNGLLVTRHWMKSALKTTSAPGPEDLLSV